MPTDKVARRVQDVLRNITSIESYTSGLDLNAFQQNSMVQDAVERCLERIAEATRKLGEAFDERFIDDLDLHEVRQFGSVLRHDYDVIDSTIIWNVLQMDLPKLKFVFETLEKEYPAPKKNTDPDFDPFLSSP